MNEELTDDVKIEEKHTSRKNRKLFRLLCIASSVIIPVCIFVSAVYFVLTQPVFYTEVLKRSAIIAAFFKERNVQLDQKLQFKVEEKYGIQTLEKKELSARQDYEAKKLSFSLLNKTLEYDELKARLKQTENMEWEDVKEQFPDKDEFKKNRKETISIIEKEMDAIEDYRDEQEDQIEKAEDEMKDALKLLNNITDDLADAREGAEEMISDEKGAFSETVLADMENITPELTSVLNETLIDGQIKQILADIINFFSSRDQQVENGNIYYEESKEGLPLPELKIHLPRISFDLVVDEQKYGKKVKRHLISEIFAEIVDGRNDLHNKTVLYRAFRFSDSALAEIIGRSKLKKLGLDFENGRISAGNIVLAGKTAIVMDNIMTVLSMKTVFHFVLPGTALFLVLLIILWPGEKKGKKRRVRFAVVLPCVTGIIFCAVLIFCSAFGKEHITELLAKYAVSGYVQSYVESCITPALVFLFVPCAAAFAVPVWLSRLLRIRKQG